MKGSFTYTYGNMLTEEESGQRIKEHLLNVLIISIPLLLSVGGAMAADQGDFQLIKSIEEKSSKFPTPAPVPDTPPTTIRLPRPKTLLARGANSVAIGAALVVLSINAQWDPTPIKAVICLAAFTGYVVPSAFAKIFKIWRN